MKYPTIFLCLIFSLPSLVMSQSQSLSFLTIGGSSNQLSLGEATTAKVTNGMNMWVNPATLGGLEDNVVSADYTLWGISDNQISTFSLVLTEKNQRLGIGFISNTTGDIETRNVPGPALSTANVTFLSIAASYAYSFKFVHIGAMASYVSEQYISDNAGGYSLGFGFYSPLLNNKLKLGASINHFGEMNAVNTVSSQLPTELRFGLDADLLSFSLAYGDGLSIILNSSIDYVRYIDNFITSSDGSPINDLNRIIEKDALFTSYQIRFGELASLNFGYRFLIESNRNFSFGLGLNYEMINVNFAFVPFSEGFNNGYSIGLSYLF